MAGDSPVGRDVRGLAGRFSFPRVSPSMSLSLDFPLFLARMTRRPLAESRFESFPVCPDDRLDRMAIRRRSVIPLVLSEDDRQDDRPEFRKIDVTNAVGPALSSGRFPPRKPDPP